MLGEWESSEEREQVWEMAIFRDGKPEVRKFRVLAGPGVQMKAGWMSTRHSVS